MRLTTLIVPIVGLLALSPVALASSKWKAETDLVRPDGAPDPDAKGELEIRVNPGKGWQRFEVSIEDVDTDATYRLWIQDALGSDTYIEVGQLALDGDGDGDDDDDDDDDDDKTSGGSDDGELELKLDTKKGDGLPLGVKSVADLEDLRVEVRRSGDVIVFGKVPALGGSGDDDDDDSPGNGNGKAEALTYLTRPDDAPEASAKGRVRLRIDGKKGEQEFDVEAEQIQDLDADYEVFLQEDLDDDAMTSLGLMERDDDEFELDFETDDGDMLPLGVDDLRDLAGLRLEIRRGDDVILFGDIPAFDAPSKPWRARDTYGAGPDGGSKTKGRIDMRSKASKGDQRFTLMGKALPQAGNPTYRLWVESGLDEDGITVLYEDCGALDPLGSSKNARYRRKSKQGQSLPLGVASVVELAGLRFEVRDGEGQVVLAGLLPDD